jgi:signal transduction histidine kinase
MKPTLKIIGTLVVWLAVLAGTLGADPTEAYRFELKTISGQDFFMEFPVDYDGDGTDELIGFSFFSGSGEVSLRKQDGQWLWMDRFGRDAALNENEPAIFANGKPPAERALSFSYRQGDSILIYFNPVNGPPRSVFIGLRPLLVNQTHPDWSGEFGCCTFLDVDDDGEEDIVGSWTTGVPQYPRGLAAYDRITGRELWHYWIGPQVRTPCYEDINGDGKKEILIGTYAPANGASANGTDDEQTYVMAFDRKGSLLWQKSIGGYFTGAYIQTWDADRDGKPDVLCWEEGQRADADSADALMVLDAGDGSVKKIVRCGRHYRGLRVTDLNNDGREEIIMGNTDGWLRVFSSALEQQQERLCQEGVGVALKEVADLDGDGHQEVVVICQDGRLMVLNHRLEDLLTQSGNVWESNVRLANSGHTKRLLTWRNAGHALRHFELLEFVPKPIYTDRVFLYKVIGTLFLVILLGLGGIVWLWTIQNRMYLRLIQKTERMGLVALNRRGRVMAMTPKAQEMLKLSYAETKGKKLADLLEPGTFPGWREALREKGWEVHRPLEIIRKDKRSLIDTLTYHFPEGKVILLEDAEERTTLQRLRSWAPVAQELAHGIKNPLSTVLLGVQKIRRLCQEGAEREEVCKRIEGYAGSIEEEIQRLRKATDGFMRFVNLEAPQKEALDLEALLSGLVQKHQANAPEGVTMKFQKVEALPSLLADRRQLETAIGNILDNAVGSLGDKGEVVVTAKLADAVDRELRPKAMVSIGVTDNGCGIPDDYQGRLFKPFVSFKPGGTGLGLALTKRIVEDHGGSVSIASKEGIGTTVTVFLPAS